MVVYNVVRFAFKKVVDVLICGCLETLSTFFFDVFLVYKVATPRITGFIVVISEFIGGSQTFPESVEMRNLIAYNVLQIAVLNE